MRKTFPLTGWDSLQLLTKRFSDQQVRAVVEFEGRLDETRLAEAIRSAVLAEPILACRVSRRFFHPRWTPVRGSDAGALLRIFVETDPEPAIRQLLIEDLDPWRGPIVRFGLVRSERDTLVINLDHTAGDAASVRSLAQLVAAFYSRPGRAAVADAAAYFGKRSFRDLLRLVPPGHTTRKPAAPPADSPPNWRFPWQPRAAGSAKRIELRFLPPARTETIVAFAAKRSAWLNDVFLAAYFRALARLLGEDRGVRALTIPVDLRKYLPARERPRVANFSASFIMTLRNGLGDSLDDTLGLVRAAMAAEKQGLPGLDQAAALSALADRIPYRILENRLAKGKAPISLPPPWFIALGVLRPESFAFGPVPAGNAFVLPSNTPAGGIFQLSASCFAQRTTLAVSFSGDETNDRVVKRFLDFYEAELPM